MIVKYFKNINFRVKGKKSRLHKIALFVILENEVLLWLPKEPLYRLQIRFEFVVVFNHFPSCGEPSAVAGPKYVSITRFLHLLKEK